MHLSLTPAACSLVAVTAFEVGYIFDRAFPSDHLPVMARIALARRGDHRILTPIDPRVFESPAFFDTLAMCRAATSCLSVAEAQDQFSALQTCVRDLSHVHQFRAFVFWVPTAPDKARFAMRAWRAWPGRQRTTVGRCFEVWPEMAEKFADGELLDIGGVRAWVEQGCDDAETEARFLGSVPNLRGAVNRRDGRVALRAAAARTGHSVPGPDGLARTLRTGADGQMTDAVFEVSRAVGRGRGAWATFQVRPALHHDDSEARGHERLWGIMRVWAGGGGGRILCPNGLQHTEPPSVCLSLHGVLAQARASAISEDQRGFIAGRSILSSAPLCEAATGEAALSSVDAAVFVLDFGDGFGFCLLVQDSGTVCARGVLCV